VILPMRRAARLDILGKVEVVLVFRGKKIEALSEEVAMCSLFLRPLGVVSQVPLLHRLQLCFAEDSLIAGILD
jgi:hypothetical protein